MKNGYEANFICLTYNLWGLECLENYEALYPKNLLDHKACLPTTFSIDTCST